MDCFLLHKTPNQQQDELNPQRNYEIQTSTLQECSASDERRL